MTSANVTFSRPAGAVEMMLTIDSRFVALSPSQESIARELLIHGVTELTIESKFSTGLPTSAETIRLAASVPFTELMAALKLIAACASMDELPIRPYPERRTRPRPERLNVGAGL